MDKPHICLMEDGVYRCYLGNFEGQGMTYELAYKNYLRSLPEDNSYDVEEFRDLRILIGRKNIREGHTILVYAFDSKQEILPAGFCDTLDEAIRLCKDNYLKGIQINEYYIDDDSYATKKHKIKWR